MQSGLFYCLYVKGNNMYLIIDDDRSLGCDIIARTPQAGKDILYNMVHRFNSNGEPLIECLCIDHDLGFEETGYDVIKFGIENHCLPDKIQIVSMNPVGKQNIANILVDNEYNTFDNINFVRS